MTHIQYHVDSKPRSKESLQKVFKFLADLRVFEALYDSFRPQQLFIYSWMQNTCVYAPTAPTSSNFFIIHVFIRIPPLKLTDSFFLVSFDPMEFGSTDRPVVSPRQISRLLVENVDRMLQSCQKTTTCLSPKIRLALKVGNFLHESAEYEHSYKVGTLIYRAARSLTVSDVSTAHVSAAWQYEAMCM